ncbi:hypothetical protein [Pedobacter sp. Hv1]|uniref:hypothetical protein n=1 Tax=Pedobacter sp. Hv1 TaxID=1740090 RepID=UPI0006D892C0|nr:hypothetical protein [Pedobacter sp. Hv1]KQB99435.1 hypothetical protein AQF98_17860 [Pedobacter sp. Hv1]
MKNILYKYGTMLLLVLVLGACKKDGHNVAKAKYGKQPGINYEPLANTTVGIKDKITFKANLVSMDDIKEVSGYLIEVLTINSFGNPASEGNKFFIGTNKINDKQNNTVFDGAVNIVYNGQDNFKTGNMNEHAKYTVTGTIDLSKYRLVVGKRYRLSLNFVTFPNMNTLESPLMFVVQ